MSLHTVTITAVFEVDVATVFDAAAYVTDTFKDTRTPWPVSIKVEVSKDE